MAKAYDVKSQVSSAYFNRISYIHPGISDVSSNKFLGQIYMTGNFNVDSEWSTDIIQ